MKHKLRCVMCGQAFERYPSKRGDFCSRTCANREKAQIRAKRMKETFVERFWKRVAKGPKCWTWLGATSDGYGTLKREGRTESAHVVAWELTRGRRRGRYVLHSCDNRACTRPEHLFLGNHRDNMADMRWKGRSSKNVGMKNPNRKLRRGDIKRIRSLYARHTQQELAKMFHVGQPHISRILRRVAWMH